MFSQVFVCPQGGSALRRGLPWLGGGGGVSMQTTQKEYTPQKVDTPPPPPTRQKTDQEYGQYAVDTHPTGMHSCYLYVFELKKLFF